MILQAAETTWSTILREANGTNALSIILRNMAKFDSGPLAVVDAERDCKRMGFANSARALDVFNIFTKITIGSAPSTLEDQTYHDAWHGFVSAIGVVREFKWLLDQDKSMEGVFKLYRQLSEDEEATASLLSYILTNLNKERPKATILRNLLYKTAEIISDQGCDPQAAADQAIAIAHGRNVGRGRSQDETYEERSHKDRRAEEDARYLAEHPVDDDESPIGSDWD